MKSFSLILLAIALARATPVPCADGNENSLCVRHSTTSSGLTLLPRHDGFGDDSGDATPKAAESRASPRATAAGNCAAASPKINAATTALLKKFEGFVASPDPDPVGLPTVGFGHKCQQAGCKEVPFSFPLSQANADTLLQTDSQTFTKCVDADVAKNVVLNDNQFGALSSFLFNLGCGALKSSTFLRTSISSGPPNFFYMHFSTYAYEIFVSSTSLAEAWSSMINHFSLWL